MFTRLPLAIAITSLLTGCGAIGHSQFARTEEPLPAWVKPADPQPQREDRSPIIIRATLDEVITQRRAKRAAELAESIPLADESTTVNEAPPPQPDQPESVGLSEEERVLLRRLQSQVQDQEQRLMAAQLEIAELTQKLEDQNHQLTALVAELQHMDPLVGEQWASLTTADYPHSRAMTVDEWLASSPPAEQEKQIELAPVEDVADQAHSEDAPKPLPAPPPPTEPSASLVNVPAVSEAEASPQSYNVLARFLGYSAAKAAADRIARDLGDTESFIATGSDEYILYLGNYPSYSRAEIRRSELKDALFGLEIVPN